ncbi:MAG: hypothetical protein HWN67_04395 [Candidatus Helarchaeota archaeon]|nr:hypothetical protein [Candidatus Helarchaeota archaeon]
MVIETVLIPFGSFVMKKIGSKIWKKIKDWWKNRKRKKVSEILQGKLETKYPRIDGVGNPWCAYNAQSYYKSFVGESIDARIEYALDKTSATLLLPIQNLQSLPDVKQSAGVLSVGIPYRSEVDLELGENFLTDNKGVMQLNFGVPTEILKEEVDYTTKMLTIPLKFRAPVEKAKVLFIRPPKPVPSKSKKVDIPFGRKVDAEIPIL